MRSDKHCHLCGSASHNRKTCEAGEASRTLSPAARLLAMAADGLVECRPCGALLWVDGRGGKHACPAGGRSPSVAR